MTATFQTERLRARAWTPDDADDAFAIYGDVEVLRWLGDGRKRPVPGIEVMRRTLETWLGAREAPLGRWALERIADGVVVGAVLLVPLENRGPEIEIGWHLARAHWGNGYASEGAAGALRYAFDQMGLTRVVALVYPDNERSLKVCARLGLRHEGRRHAYDHDLEYFVAER